jgi:hypothetical protein
MIIRSHPLYKMYIEMKGRCNNPNHSRYKSYGGRGISVCERWSEYNSIGFLNFINDMGGKPSAYHSLDRIDNDKGYFPENCRWATIHEQNSNRRNNIKNIGVSYDVKRKRYVSRIRINGTNYQKHFKTEEEAMSYRKKLEELYLK